MAEKEPPPSLKGIGKLNEVPDRRVCRGCRCYFQPRTLTQRDCFNCLYGNINDDDESDRYGGGPDNGWL